MNSSRIALYAALAATVSWTAKAVAIGTAGGLDRSPLEGPFFFAGMACFTVAAVSFGVAVTRGRATWLRAMAGVVGFVVLFQLAQLLDTVVDRTVGGAEADRHWVWAEVSLWVSALVMLALVAAHRGRARTADLTVADRQVTRVGGPTAPA